MIFVTLGTQDRSFKRLLDAIQKQIDNGNIKDKVVVQAGHTTYESKDMEIFDLIDRDKFSELISNCDLLITHGGVGSILTGLNNNKKVIATPRLKEYNVEDDEEFDKVADFFEDELFGEADYDAE